MIKNLQTLTSGKMTTDQNTKEVYAILTPCGLVLEGKMERKHESVNFWDVYKINKRNTK